MQFYAVRESTVAMHVGTRLRFAALQNLLCYRDTAEEALIRGDFSSLQQSAKRSRLILRDARLRRAPQDEDESALASPDPAL